MDPPSSSDRYGGPTPDTVAYPRQHDPDAALGRASGDSSSGGSSYQRRSLVFLANAISTRDSALRPSTAAAGSIDEHHVNLSSTNASSSGHGVTTRATPAGQEDRGNHLPLPSSNADGFAASYHGEPTSVSPGTIPPSSDYWSAKPPSGSGSKSRSNRRDDYDDDQRRLIALLHSSGHLDAPSVRNRHSNDTAQSSDQAMPSGIPKSKSGSRIARAFSKRRPRTSISDLETNRSLSPEAGFPRQSGSTTQESMEGARSSASNEQQRARANSVAGSVDSTRFPTTSTPQEGSRLESSGGARIGLNQD
ncbi:unnamed protein product [Sympodiomycopsis kandeliae]